MTLVIVARTTNHHVLAFGSPKSLLYYRGQPTEHPISLLSTGPAAGQVVTFELEPDDESLADGSSAETEGPNAGRLIEIQYRWNSLADRLTDPQRSPQLLLVGSALERIGLDASERMRPGFRER